MSTQQTLEERHESLQNRLHENLQRKHDLELRINQQYGELKELEIFLEKSHERGRSLKEMNLEH